MVGPSGSNSVVECDLAKVEVAGSNPVSRSRFPRFQLASCSVVHRLGTHSIEQGRGTQVVRERSSKPLCVGSIPTRASTFSTTLSDQQRTVASTITLQGASGSRTHTTTVTLRVNGSNLLGR